MDKWFVVDGGIEEDSVTLPPLVECTRTSFNMASVPRCEPITYQPYDPKSSHCAT